MSSSHLFIYYGKLNIGQKWITSFGYGCQKCKQNFFKSSKMNFNNDSCQQCPEMTLSSEDNSHCYNPYEPSYISFSQLTSIISLSISAVGLFLSLFIIITLWRYKETPFAKSTNLKHTLLHLTLSSCQFALLPYFYIGKPTTIK